MEKKTRKDNHKFARFTLRLEEEDEEQLKILSHKYNLTKAGVLRQIIRTDLDKIETLIKEKQELKENFKTLAFQLQKIGVVLNQVNRNFFDNKEVKIEEIKKEIDDLWQLLKQLKE